jgi:hypothetical protein
MSAGRGLLLRDHARVHSFLAVHFNPSTVLWAACLGFLLPLLLRERSGKPIEVIHATTIHTFLDKEQHAPDSTSDPSFADRLAGVRFLALVLCFFE